MIAKVRFLMKQLIEATSVDELHDQKGIILVAAIRIHWNDIRMVKPGHGVSFEFKSFRQILRRRLLKRNHLDGNDSPHLILLGSINRSHGPTTDFLLDLALSEQCLRKLAAPLFGLSQRAFSSKSDGNCL